jgi:hypothetical protein
MRPVKQRPFTFLEAAVIFAWLALMSMIIIEGLTFGSGAHTQTVERDDADWGVFLANQSMKGLIETTYPDNASVMQPKSSSCARPP